MADVGQKMVKNLYKEMMVDKRWAVRTERGFTWWGYRHAQHVEAGLPVRSAGFDVCSVRIWTDVARDVNPASNPAVAIAAVNFEQTLNALVWNSADRTITECCTAIVHKENIGWLGKILAVAALLQNVEAHNRAQELADACGGTPAASNHPTSGQRAAMAETLNVPDQVVLPVGTEPSRFAGPLSEGLGDFAASMGWLGFSSAHGMTCEVPYSGSQPAALLKIDNPQAPVETALVRIFTDHPHPEAGNGALIVMQLPVAPGVDAAPLLANQLNAVEAAGYLSASLLGAWCPDFFSKDGNGLAFCCFLPNLIARPGLLENLIVYQAARAQFALRQLSSIVASPPEAISSLDGLHKVMISDTPSPDLSWRPATYFWPASLATQLLAKIKGAARRSALQRLIDEGRLDEIPDFLATAGLPEEERDAIGRIHPLLMGGEYLPDQDEGEIEIARIEINSTTGDVTSVYARQDGPKIRYRVVDEYDGGTLSGPTECTSTEPLTLGELEEFFLGAWPLVDVLEMNFQAETEEMLRFFRAFSEFYPDFDQLLRERVIAAYPASDEENGTAEGR